MVPAGHKVCRFNPPKPIERHEEGAVPSPRDCPRLAWSSPLHVKPPRIDLRDRMPSITVKPSIWFANRPEVATTESWFDTVRTVSGSIRIGHFVRPQDSGSRMSLTTRGPLLKRGDAQRTQQGGSHLGVGDLFELFGGDSDEESIDSL